MSLRGDLWANLLCPRLHSLVWSSLFNCELLENNRRERKDRKRLGNDFATQVLQLKFRFSHFSTNAYNFIEVQTGFTQIKTFLVISVVCICTSKLWKIKSGW